MKNDNQIRDIKYFMLGVNILVSLFVVTVVLSTSRNIVEAGKAFEFLSSAERLPYRPASLFVITIICNMCLLFTFFLRQFVLEQGSRAFASTLLVDAGVVALILLLNNANYNGYILWVVANFLQYMESSRRLLVISLGVMLYMLTSSGIVRLLVPVWRVEDYIGYYGGNTTMVLLFIYYGFEGLNLVSFLLFSSYIIQTQKDIIEEVNTLYGQLRVANEELKELADIKEKMGQTKERNRLAREIHDTLGHSLTGISVGLDAVLAMVDKNPEMAKEQLKVILSVAREGMADVRHSVSTLRVDDVEHVSLQSRLDQMIKQTQRATNVSISFIVNDELKYEEYESNLIFRVIQESITNAIRHGGASAVTILCGLSDGQYQIRIKDNGKGCAEIKPGFGLTHMKERVSMLHGTLSFSSDNGFCVDVRLPIRGEG